MTEQKRQRRFWKKVNRDTACWIWTGARNRYGLMKIAGKQIGVHRYSYELHNGPVRADSIVMHRCDNPLCVNPAHLRLGTHQENRMDCVRKNRQAKGSRQGHSRFTEEDIHSIRTRRRDGERLITIAADYNTHASVISGIANRMTWRHI